MNANFTQNCPLQCTDQSIRILYWNAGGLNSSNFLEFRHLVFIEDADVYFIVEAGLATESPDFMS
jgi:hypothetical protein